MKSIGYCQILANAKTGKGIAPSEMGSFLGEICVLQEIASDGGVLVMNRKGTALGMFDKEDVVSHFLCDTMSGIPIPPGLDVFERMGYYSKLMERVGGYSDLLKGMVIVASLHKGEYDDRFLFQKQNQDELNEIIKNGKHEQQQTKR